MFALNLGLPMICAQSASKDNLHQPQLTASRMCIEGYQRRCEGQNALCFRRPIAYRTALADERRGSDESGRSSAVPAIRSYRLAKRQMDRVVAALKSWTSSPKRCAECSTIESTESVARLFSCLCLLFNSDCIVGGHHTRAESIGIHPRQLSPESRINEE
jgi:hypothetical protein